MEIIEEVGGNSFPLLSSLSPIRGEGGGGGVKV
jgi:hypothetical protein